MHTFGLNAPNDVGKMLAKTENRPAQGIQQTENVTNEARNIRTQQKWLNKNKRDKTQNCTHINTQAAQEWDKAILSRKYGNTG